ncbi:mucin-20 [Perognathus longimembris pacificus]|uniref:mucin-20 n=1 Tax=Perognathus longimembris pacificus TaxID=214514 RepID=UPI0020199099|nr:mucin-20 [Perognathus longimembris pacificus]
MGCVWGLALSFLFFSWEAGGSRSSAGPSTSGPVPLVTTNNTGALAMTEGIKTSSERALQTTDLHEPFMSSVSLQTQTLSSRTISKTLITANNRSEAESKETRTISPSAGVRETPPVSPLQENWTFSKIIAPTTAAVMTTPKETFTPRGSPTARRTHRGTGTRRIPMGAIFAHPCTSESSEEAHWITVDISTRADTPTESESLSSESSSSSSDSSSQALASGTSSTQAKALAAYSIIHIQFTNCSITKIETAAIISKTSDTGPRPTEEELALSTSESSAVPHSLEEKPYISNTTAFAEALSSASTLDTARGTWVTVTRKPIEETSVLSFETSSHTEVPGALPVSMGAGSTGGTGPSFAASSASVYSPSDPAATKDSTLSETLTTASVANRATSGSPASTVHPATASLSHIPSVHPATTATSHTPSLTSEGAFWTAGLHESSVPRPVPLHTQTPSTASFPKSIITAGSVAEMDIRESQTTSPTPGTMETPTNSPAVESSGALAISPEAETPETQATSSTSETTVTPHISPAVESSGALAISPEAETLETQATSSTSETTETPTNSPAVESSGALAISPEAETPEMQATSSTSETTVTPHISPAVESSGALAISPNSESMETLITSTDTETSRTQTTSPAAELEGTLTGSSTTEIMETPTISPGTEPTETLSTSPGAETREIGTISSELEFEGTLTITPAAETRETPPISAATQTMETPTSFPVAEMGTHFTKTIPPTITPPYLTRPGTPTFVSDTAATKSSSPFESSTTESTAHRSIPTSRCLPPSILPATASGSPLPSDYLITATRSQETNTTFIKITASPMTPIRPLTSTPGPFWSRQTTGVTIGGDGGLLLVRLSVASPEDLTEPSVAEKLIEELHCELLAHKLLVQISLLRVKRD